MREGVGPLGLPQPAKGDVQGDGRDERVVLDALPIGQLRHLGLLVQADNRVAFAVPLRSQPCMNSDLIEILLSSAIRCHTSKCGVICFAWCENVIQACTRQQRSQLLRPATLICRPCVSGRECAVPSLSSLHSIPTFDSDS